VAILTRALTRPPFVKGNAPALFAFLFTVSPFPLFSSRSGGGTPHLPFFPTRSFLCPCWATLPPLVAFPTPFSPPPFFPPFFTSCRFFHFYEIQLVLSVFYTCAQFLTGKKRPDYFIPWNRRLKGNWARPSLYVSLPRLTLLTATVGNGFFFMGDGGF